MSAAVMSATMMPSAMIPAAVMRGSVMRRSMTAPRCAPRMGAMIHAMQGAMVSRTTMFVSPVAPACVSPLTPSLTIVPASETGTSGGTRVILAISLAVRRSAIGRAVTVCRIVSPAAVAIAVAVEVVHDARRPVDIHGRPAMAAAPGIPASPAPAPSSEEGAADGHADAERQSADHGRAGAVTPSPGMAGSRSADTPHGASGRRRSKGRSSGYRSRRDWSAG